MQTYQDRILATLGDRDPIEVLQHTPLLLEALLERFGPSDFETPYGEGKWTARDILAHLADVEIAHSFRIRQILADSEPVLQPFDQDDWARRYNRADPALAVAAFRGLRSWNLALLATLDLDDWLRQGYHPERGMQPIELIIRTLAGHDLNHLRQLETIAAGGI